MKYALVGYGKMGKMIESLSADHIEIAAIFDEVPSFENTDSVRKLLEGVDVILDFSVPGAALSHIRTACELKIPLVMGTTGWIDHLEEVQIWVKESGTGLIFASNFSLGIHLFNHIVDYAASICKEFRSYDIYIHEAHHQFKKDAPSGTALTLKTLLTSSYPQHLLPISSIRAGFIPGTHCVGFDSAADTIELKHTARNREGFAQGALLAAHWIADKKGCFEFGDVFHEMIS